MHARGKGKSDKKAVIPFTDTSADPRTMMVVNFDASATILAVERTRWSPYVARSTLRNFDLFRSDQGVVEG